jgi:hypothetical protein
LFFFRRAVAPSVKAVNQLVGAPVESHVLLQCIVEAYAKPLNTWYRSEGIVSRRSHPRDDESEENFSCLFVRSFFSIYRNDLNFSSFFSALIRHHSTHGPID